MAPGTKAVAAGTASRLRSLTRLAPALYRLGRHVRSERGAVMGTTSAFLDLAFGLGPATLGFMATAIGRDAIAIFLTGSAVAVAGPALVADTRLGGRQGPRPTRVEQLSWGAPARGDYAPGGTRVRQAALAGSTLWLLWKTFSGSYRRLRSASRR